VLALLVRVVLAVRAHGTALLVGLALVGEPDRLARDVPLLVLEELLELRADDGAGARLAAAAEEGEMRPEACAALRRSSG
jgi:hypothetical protein